MGLYNIMIADDEAEVREGIVRKIDWEAAGFQIVAQVENGQEALEKAESLDIDVVLTDIKMPFMDGLTFGTHLQRLHPSVKLVIFTGFDKFEYAKEAIKLNVIEYVLKPVNAEELTQVLKRIKLTLDDELAKRRNIDMLTEAYKNSLPLMRDHFLSQVMLGTVSSQEIESQLKYFEIPINIAKYKVVTVFELDIIGGESPIIDKKLLPISLKQLVDDCLKTYCHHASFISSSAVIAATAWDDDPIENMMMAANEVCLEFARVYKANVTAGIGRTYEDVRSIHESFAEAKSAVEYKLVMQSNRVIYIKDVELTERSPMIYDNRYEHLLLSAVKFGSIEQIRSLLDSILSKLDGIDKSDWRYQAYMMSVLSTVFQMISRYGLDDNEILGDSSQRFLMLMSQNTPEKMKKWIADTCVNISKNIREKRITAAINLVEQAKQFINENYHCTHLTVDIICEHLHISQSYFSTIFKQEAGISYVGYLTDVRMEEALRLLNETDDKTYIIAQKVGYDEPNYFSYVFKKKFGASPSQYRK